MKPFYEQTGLRFSCTRCGKCCKTGKGYYVFMAGQEAESIREYLGLSKGWFRRRYLERLDSGELVAADAGDGSCVFLDCEGQCSVYAVRPVQCRTYPFWPEIVSTRTGWKAERRRCEGIDHGRTVSQRRVRKALRACSDTD